MKTAAAVVLAVVARVGAVGLAAPAGALVLTGLAPMTVPDAVIPGEPGA